MNTQVMPQSPQPQAIARAPITEASRVYWSLRREFWESRWIYIAPLAVAVLALAGFFINLVRISAKLRGAEALDQALQRQMMLPYASVMLLLMFTTFIVAMLYCLDTLQGERRDRSILFWKSLPVSDLTTVLSKASIPIIILPLLTFVLTVATQLIMLVLSSVVLLGSGAGAMVWGHSSVIHIWPMLLYHLVVMHGIWYAPIYGWLLLVSAWSRRAAFLWAILPVFAIAMVERIAFNTSHFAGMLALRMSGGPPGGGVSSTSGGMNQMERMMEGGFMSTTGILVGLAVTAVFLGGAIWLRRYRAPN